MRERVPRLSQTVADLNEAGAIVISTVEPDGSFQMLMTMPNDVATYFVLDSMVRLASRWHEERTGEPWPTDQRESVEALWAWIFYAQEFADREEQA